MEDNSRNIKEERIRKLTQLYYSREDVKKTLLEFSKNREVVPRYFESFGKRPDAFQYVGDIFELAKKGATSFHCSEELWSNPLALSTELKFQELNELREGWDLLIDIDSRYIDYSKIFAELVLDVLKFHGVKNVGVKFSGSKGFHLIIPWSAFPREVNRVKTSDMFPEWPRIITQYISYATKDKLIEKISELSRPSKYVMDFSASEQVIPDLILVSPRHLFRMPYSLHEKTALASVVLNNNEICNFQLKDANPLKTQIKKFMPDAEKNEASELLVQALDWSRENLKVVQEKKDFDFKPIQIHNLSEDLFPPSIKKIMQGMSDGRKRALFILINFFRSINLDKAELEKNIFAWNQKNGIPLKDGYIQAQLSWSYKNKIVPPPNFDKDYYKGIGIVPTEEEMRFKNPVSYVLKKYKTR